MLLEDLLEEYTQLRRSQGKSEHTIDRINLTIRKIAREMDINNLEQFTTDVITEWGERQKSLGVTNSGLFANYNSVKSFLRFLEDSDIEHDVNRKLVRCKPNYRRKKTLRPWEITKIIKNAPHDIGVLIRAYYTCGLRESEALTIKAADILPNNTIIISGKWLTDEPVYLTPELVAELRYLGKGGGWCFKDRKDSDRPMDRKIAYYYVKKAMIQAGFPNNSVHDLRHSFCTELLRQDVPTLKAMVLMRHKKIETTQRYTHLLEEDAQAAHMLLPRV